jgi:hypothetical protein
VYLHKHSTQLKSIHQPGTTHLHINPINNPASQPAGRNLANLTPSSISETVIYPGDT